MVADRFWNYNYNGDSFLVQRDKYSSSSLTFVLDHHSGIYFALLEMQKGWGK
jgi:hypothetical protein